MHGPIMQLGYVVGDIATSAANWRARTGAGPFFHLPSMAFDRWAFNGAPQDLVLHIAFAQLGDIMVELIEPVGPWPNVYGDAPLPKGACRPHHHAFLVGDLDGAAAHLAAGTPVTTGQISDSAQLRYYDCRDTLGLLVELISDTPDTRAFFDIARQGAEGWDGGGPVLRPIPAMGDAA
ncbi:VOC family protein [Novosphingobium olei]|nr:VOC family protein [Novosphingobium olei]